MLIFFGFLRPDLSPWGCRYRCFLVALHYLIVRRPNLAVATKRLLHQWGSQKLLQGLASHQLTAYLPVFNLFLTRWIMTILSKGYKPDNFEPHTSLKLSFTNFEALVPILLNVNLSLNQTLLTFLLYVRQTWMTQLILVISLWGVIFLASKRILLLICILICMVICIVLCMVICMDLCEGRISYGTGFIFRKLCKFLLMFSTGFTSSSVSLLFPLLIIFFVFMYSFSCYFI